MDKQKALKAMDATPQNHNQQAALGSYGTPGGIF